MDQWLLPAWLDEAVARRLESLDADQYGERLWEADATLWKPEDEAHQKVIGNALGWLSVYEGVREQVEGLTEFVDELRAEGFRSAVLLGMGGSSLAPEVMREVLGVREGYLDLHVLDSTDPAAVLAVEAAVDLETTLFIVSSKSGGTTETASFHAYFYERLRELDGDHAGHHFVAVTDEGTSLQEEALAQGFRAIFVNPGDIGGRYSALSFFGIVPAALMGVDLERLLDGVRDVAVACGPDVPAGENPALRLGALLGEAALAGRDKLTIVAEPPLRALGAWVEQLVAESTGKEGRGILPVDLETARGRGRVRRGPHLRRRSASAAWPPPAWRGSSWTSPRPGIRSPDTSCPTSTRSAASSCAGRSRWPRPAACWASTPSTSPTCRRARTTPDGCSPATSPAASCSRTCRRARAVWPTPCTTTTCRPRSRSSSPRRGRATTSRSRPTCSPARHVWEDLQALRLGVRDQLRLATTLGYGPRFLHSTGQLHKGGPNTGLFLQLVGHDPVDVEIPGQPYSFSVLKRAQARGDLGALRAHGCRALRVNLGDDPAAALRRLGALLAGALSQ